MKMPLGTEVDLGAGHIVLDGFPALCGRGTAPPSFRPMFIVAMVAHLSYYWALVMAVVGMNCLSHQRVAWMMLLHGRNVLIIPMLSLSTRHSGLLCMVIC